MAVNFKNSLVSASMDKNSKTILFLGDGASFDLKNFSIGSDTLEGKSADNKNRVILIENVVRVDKIPKR